MNECFKGLLIVNKFLLGDKFFEIYNYLREAAARAGLLLDIKTNADFAVPAGCVLDKAAVKEAYDYVLFWDKDIPLARAFEQMGIRVFNSSAAIEISDDKALTFEKLADADILMPKTFRLPMTYENIGYTSMDFWENYEAALSYPMVIKECHGSFGAQVYLAKNRTEAELILKKIGGHPAIVQQYIEESCGRDVRINMVGSKAVAAMERTHDSDFRANITNGGRMHLHEVSEAELMLCQRVMKVLGLDFAGVDILYSKKGPMLCEVNSNAHFKNIYDCTGVNVAEAIMDYIKEELQ